LPARSGKLVLEVSLQVHNFLLQTPEELHLHQCVGSGVEASGDSTEGDSTPEDEADESSTRARVINQRVSGWAYRIPQYKFDSMNKRLEDLLLAVKDTDE